MKALAVLVVATFGVLAALVAKLTADHSDSIVWQDRADRRLQALEKVTPYAQPIAGMPESPRVLRPSQYRHSSWCSCRTCVSTRP